jgi:integrase
MSLDDVNQKFKDLESQVQTFYKKKAISDDEYTDLLGYALLSLYVLQEPRRNKDYCMMRVVEAYDPEALSPDYNYFDLSKKRFIFNNYKTSKKYGRQDIKINNELMNALKKYLKHRSSKLEMDDQNDKPFLIRADGRPLDKSGDITKLLNKIFGKAIGSSMIRHITITDKVGETHKDLQKMADDMAHSLPMQGGYIKKQRARAKIAVDM